MTETISPKKRPIIALYTYGGGMRGLIPAHFMQKIEETTGLHMADMVDIFCGPSTGSILNAALNHPHPYEPGTPKFKARHMVRFYEREGSQIFPQDAFRSFRSLIHDFNNRTMRISQLDRLLKQGHYEQANLGRALRALFGRTKLSESLKSLVIPVYNIDSRYPKATKDQNETSADIALLENRAWNLVNEGGHAVWLKNLKFDGVQKYHSPPEVTLYDAVMGSTAAPTYFQCHHFLMRPQTGGAEREISAIDGSIFDNPCMTYMGALRHHIPADRDLIFIVIGTGYANRSIAKEDWNRFGSIGVVDPNNDMPLINIFFHASESALYEAYSEEMGDRTFTFNKSMVTGDYRDDYPSTNIDDASPENIRRLKNFFEMSLEENRKKFDHICDLLVKNYEAAQKEKGEAGAPPSIRPHKGLRFFKRKESAS
ncbi:MAG: phospholipase [Micavibrio aeruginosavorus]|uniref:Phospholipase n=1 Tax=Micavibrio aeruginosavorus TaxID=349221 RepID=A0A2W5FHZ8_9BACT|nr:MAG: phospholipase [Micavibrio aeruginosavorus]